MADPFGRIAAGEVSKEDLSMYRNETIPTLNEALRFTRDASFCVNLELKRLSPPMENFPMVERVLASIEDAGIDYGRVIVSSFHHPWLREVRTRNPSLAIQALIGYSETDPLDWGGLEFETYNARGTLIDENQVRVITEKGISINLFTVNDEDEMLRFMKRGCDRFDHGFSSESISTVAGVCCLIEVIRGARTVLLYQQVISYDQNGCNYYRWWFHRLRCGTGSGTSRHTPLSY